MSVLFQIITTPHPQDYLRDEVKHPQNFDPLKIKRGKVQKWFPHKLIFTAPRYKNCIELDG